MRAFVSRNWLVILIFMAVIALAIWTYLGYVELSQSLQRMQVFFLTQKVM